VPYPVLVEKPEDLVASFKMTVMILAGGTIAITGLPLDESKLKTDKKIKNEELKAFLATSMDKAEQKKQKKQAAKKVVAN
jgi:hypothetical protein